MSGRSEEATSAARGSVRLFAMQVFGRVSGALFAVVATRVLVPAEFGRYAAAVAIAVLFGTLADAGAGPATARLISRHELEPRAVLATVVPLMAPVGLLAAVVATAVGGAALGDEARVDVAIAVAGLPLQAMASSISGALDGTNRVSTRATIGYLNHVSQFGVGALLVVATEDVRLALASVPLGSAMVLVASLVVARREQLWSGGIALSRSVARVVVATAWPFALLGAISVVAARLDVVLLSWLVGSEEAGVYDVAARFVEAAGFVVAAVGTPMLVILNRRRAAGDADGAQRAVDAGSRILLAAGLALSVLVTGSARSIVGVLGDGYDEAVVPLRILGGQLWLVFLTGLFGTILLSTDQLGRVVPVAAGITASGVVLDFVLIPSYAEVGAAVASVCASVVAVVVFSAAAARWGEPRPHLPSVPLLLAAVASAALATAVDLGPLGPASVVVGPAVFLLAAWQLRAIGPSDLRWLGRSSRPGD